MIRFVSVCALSDEASISSRFNPVMERCAHTGVASRLRLFAFPGPHSERHQEPAWAARKETSPCQQYGSMHWPRCEGGDRMTVQVIWGRGVKGVMGESLAGTTGPRNTGSHGNGQCRDSTLNRVTRAGDHPKPLHRYSYAGRN